MQAIAPPLQIRQQRAILGIDADLGQYDMRQPRPDFELSTEQAQLSIRQTSGELTIDQSEAWHALGRGGVLTTMNQIYSQMPQIALQALAKMVDDGNRMAMIHVPGDAFAEIAGQLDSGFPDVEITGFASFFPVHYHYRASELEIEATRGSVQLDVQPNRPEVTYQRGKLDIYMQQYAKVEMIPPSIDLKH